MCGIFGYVGSKDAVSIALNGIKFLEYRGYDSAGIAGLQQNAAEIIPVKEAGNIANLEKRVQEKRLSLDMAIAHTRWATHGRPSDANAHPHFDAERKLALVHNGIIENYAQLKKNVPAVHFISETDTEVVAHLISKAYEGDLLKAVQSVIPLLQGAFALAVIHAAHPQTIVLAARESPLAIGQGEQEAFVASDPHAFLNHTQKAIFLENGETAIVTPKSLRIFNKEGYEVQKPLQHLNYNVQEVSKGEFQHFMLKEIYEQPDALRQAMQGRIDEERKTACFEELHLSPTALCALKGVQILGCGTSYHAGMLGAYLLEEFAGLDVHVSIASEFRYRTPRLPEETLVIALSQSGETADTLAAMRQMQSLGYKVLGICNVPGSTLAREADSCLQLRCGLEIGVASTKTFTSHLMMLNLLTLYLSRLRGTMDDGESALWIEMLRKIPLQVDLILQRAAKIKALGQDYANFENFIFLGRKYMFPACLEGALKLKEIAYVHASGYPAGEMKHGPIALINEACPTVAFCANKATFDKMASNLMEIKARSGRILAIGFESSDELEKIADAMLTVPDTLDPFAPILVSVIAQILSYEIAQEKGTNIDKPRNLAKSVTVE